MPSRMHKGIKILILFVLIHASVGVTALDASPALQLMKVLNISRSTYFRMGAARTSAKEFLESKGWGSFADELIRKDETAISASELAGVLGMSEQSVRRLVANPSTRQKMFAFQAHPGSSWFFPPARCWDVQTRLPEKCPELRMAMELAMELARELKSF